jgi:hypothetical protein
MSRLRDRVLNHLPLIGALAFAVLFSAHVIRHRFRPPPTVGVFDEAAILRPCQEAVRDRVGADSRFLRRAEVTAGDRSSNGPFFVASTGYLVATSGDTLWHPFTCRVAFVGGPQAAVGSWKVTSVQVR